MPNAFRPGFLACLFCFGILAAAPLHADPQTGLPLVPVFFNTQGQTADTIAIHNGPQFAYTVTNATRKNINLADAYAQATVVLNGKEYQRFVIFWVGASTLRPGESWSSTLLLKDYLYGAYQPDWKWTNPPLTDGLHTLTYKMGGKTYGPVTFIWETDAQEPPSRVPPLTLIPVFFNTQGQTAMTVSIENSPQFAFALTNATHKIMDEDDLYSQSSLLLDGKQPGPRDLHWFGSVTLRPKMTWTSEVLVKEYLPLGIRPDWKWTEAKLADGPHTLAYHMGGKTYGPVTFVWQSQPMP